MSNETTYSGILGEWQRLEAALAANTDEVPHLEPSHVLFTGMLSQALALARRQAALASEKQQVTLDFRALLVDGQRMATMLRQGLKQHYGIRSEKLTEFGLQPFRGRRTEPREPESPTEPPVETAAPTAE